jgi:hypothetical protein
VTAARFFPPLLLASVSAASVSLVACAGPAKEETQSAAGSALDEATSFDDEFQARLQDLDQKAEGCESGSCDDGSGAAATSAFRARIHPLVAGPGMNDQRSVTSFGFCEVLKPLAAVEHPYFFAGAAIQAGSAIVGGGGADLVFDLSNQQAAYFTYTQGGIAQLAGIEASVYTGVAFAQKANVLDAWSGEFQTGAASVETPFLKISAGGTIFRSPDNSLWGGAVTASIGLNLIPTVIEPSFTDGEWTAWDGATENLQQDGWFLIGSQLASADVGAQTHEYVQYDGSVSLSLALIQNLSTLGALPAAVAVALDILSSRGLTIESACP